MFNQTILKKVEDYMLLQELGRGQFATVYKARLESDPNKIFAVKMVNKKKLQINDKLSELLQTEIAIMQEIHHQNIMHLYEFMESSNNYYLVLQYCNNGDLEDYLRKKNHLSEEEAIYFLKQIMNGFRVLHQKRIMHRDIKLANIFLNNDTVVIGDFGFAKQGYLQATTILGTPLTMAPELLFKLQSSYTNKADLWSIGIVFYQLLFGVVPFDANSADQLKIKIKQYSGNKVPFPSHIRVSDQSKQLIMSLLQFDPKHRIEWYQFFNHKIFSNQIQDYTQMSQSTIFRMNQRKIDQEFKQNQQVKMETQTLLNPQELKVTIKKQQHKVHKQNEDQQLSQKQMQQIQEIEKIEQSKKLIEQKYFHEKQKILLLMFTVRKLRNMSKIRKSLPQDIAELFMFTCCILLKKGIILNEQLLISLKNNLNIYNLQYFLNFCKTDLKDQILETIVDDHNTYTQFQQQMFERFNSDVQNTQLRQIYFQLNQFSINQLFVFDDQINKNLNQLLHYTKYAQIPDKIKNYSFLTLLNLYYIQNTDKTLPFQVGNQIFDWKKFDEENIEEKAFSKLLQYKLITYLIWFFTTIYSQILFSNFSDDFTQFQDNNQGNNYGNYIFGGAFNTKGIAQKSIDGNGIGASETTSHSYDDVSQSKSYSMGQGEVNSSTKGTDTSANAVQTGEGVSLADSWSKSQNQFDQKLVDYYKLVEFLNTFNYPDEMSEQQIQEIRQEILKNNN